MPVRLRLQRHGRKRRPFYHIVAADARAKRDGRYIERIGFYDPNHTKAKVRIDREKALEWLANGAEPTTTLTSILSATGVLYKKHLQRGVKKGAFSQEVADKKFREWAKNKAKDSKIEVLNWDLDHEVSVQLGAEPVVTEVAVEVVEEDTTEA